MNKLSFISKNLIKKKYNPILNRNIIKNSLKNPLPGIDIGIPLNLFQNTYTNLYYGTNILNTKYVLLQFLIGYSVYGADRYKDAIDFQDKPYSTTKLDLYKFINENRNWIKITTDLAYFSILYLFFTEENPEQLIPFALTLYSSQWYKEIKTFLGPFKPVIISILWTACSVGLPCVLHDHDYSILSHPTDYLPCTLTLFSASNIVDNKDIYEDKKNNISTIPVLIGEDYSNMLSMVCLALSSILLGLNPHYLSNPWLNSFMEIQNAGISFLPFVLNATLA
tara:strand:- start:1177 stop:2016 length:840 start_codon:yes stop_codon:yes gene_type:complete